MNNFPHQKLVVCNLKWCVCEFACLLLTLHFVLFTFHSVVCCWLCSINGALNKSTPIKTQWVFLLLLTQSAKWILRILEQKKEKKLSDKKKCKLQFCCMNSIQRQTQQHAVHYSSIIHEISNEARKCITTRERRKKN